MSIEDCAGLVERGDADRFAAVMAAPADLRARLWPLYAFNLEVAKAAWVTKEPMIAEMRLQWWRDVVAEPTARAHEVAGPLHDLIAGAGLPLRALDQMASARVWDVYKDAFEDQADFDRYIDQTAGGLMWLAAKVCGAPDQAEETVRAYGWAAGLAGYLRAVPELEKRGRIPLLDGRSEAVQDLARAGLAKLKQARAGRALLGKAAPALLAGWQAEGLLKQVVADPRVVSEGRMGLSEFARRGGLVWQALSGRW